MRRLGRDDHGIWLGASPGAYVAKGDDPPITIEHPFCQLIPAGEWWTAIWNAGGPIELYVDIITPPTWDGGRVWMVDLDLDVVRFADGRVEVLDEDEFAEHLPLYPPRLIEKARTTAARLVVDLENRREPFGQDALPWLERLA